MIKLILITAVCILYMIKRAPERFSIPATNLNKWGVLLFTAIISLSSATFLIDIKMASQGGVDISNEEEFNNHIHNIAESSMFDTYPILSAVTILLAIAALVITVVYFMDLNKKKLSVRQIMTISGSLSIVYMLVDSIVSYYSKIFGLQTASETFWWARGLSESDVTATALEGAFSAFTDSLGLLLVLYLFHYMNVKKWYVGVSEVANTGTTTLTSAEQEYVKEYKECMTTSGSLSDGERRLLEKLREKNGISEVRAKELEGME